VLEWQGESDTFDEMSVFFSSKGLADPAALSVVCPRIVYVAAGSFL
jgi:hypothetical protein